MKKLMAMVLAIVLVLGLSSTAMAAAPKAPANGNGRGCGHGVSFTCSNYMWDADGNLVSREVFEESLDKLIEDGIILADNKSFYLERYDYCAEYGCSATGIRGGGCGGLGRGSGFGRNR